MAQTAILGAGVMGETLLSGLVRAGRRVDNLLVGEKRAERASELEERYGVAVVSNARPPRKADTLALVVKPQDMGDLLDEIASELRPGQLVVSLAAGITTAFIEARVPEGVAVVRVMPNTPALVDEGMAAISPGSHCSEEHLAEAEALMASTGKVLRIPERQQDAVTAISGSGPAYIFFVVESMIEAGVHLGPAARDRHRARRPDPGRLGQDAARDRHPPDRAPRAGHLAGRHHRGRAARARDPQGPGGVPGRDGGRARPLPGARRRQLMTMALPLTWGVTPAEARRPYAADHLVDGTMLSMTRGIGVSAPPELTWRWLCQIGGRAVLLRLDRQPRPPQPAHPDPGSRPAGARPADGGRLRAGRVRRTAPLDRGHDRARPAAVRPGRDDVRRRAGTAPARGSSAGWRSPRTARSAGPGRALLAWGDLVMMRKQLLTLKRLAERG